MANAPKVNDEQRKKIEAAIIAALTAIWLARRQAIEADLGKEISTELPAAVVDKIAAFAEDRSGKIQDGVNEYFQSALDALPPDASPEQIATTIRNTATEIDQHNQGPLSDYVDSWGDHQALYDTYDEYDALGGMDWYWQQSTDWPDECMEAEAASPAPMDELMSITGGMPPVHLNCQCDCFPA
jgi:hypothetical protein